MRELLWSRMSRFPAFSPFYCSLLPPEETLVNIEMLGGQGQKNTSAVGAHQGNSEPPGSQCVWENEISYHGESPQEGEQKPWRGLGVLAHACNPRSQVVEAGGLQIPGQPGLYRWNHKAE